MEDRIDQKNEENPPLFAIELLDLASASILFIYFFFKYLLKLQISNISVPFTFKRVSSLDLSTSHFLIAYFGKDLIDNTGLFRKYFNALSTTVPGATLVFGVSSFTKIDPSLYDYNLTLKIVKFEYARITETNPFLYQYYYAGLRFKFYSDYFEQHPEVNYAIMTDTDMLILKNPLELMENHTEVVHFMYDYKPFYVHKDDNYKWLTAWIALDDSVKQSCGITILNKTADDPDISPQLPWNSGLWMGKTTNLIKICKLIYHGFTCPGMFKNNAEQGLLNYYQLSGQIYTLGITFRGHFVPNGAFMSCPHSMNVNAFRERINTGEVYAIHHYQILKPHYVKACYPQLRGFIQY